MEEQKEELRESTPSGLSFLALLQFPLPLVLLAFRLFRVGVDEIHGGSDALRNGKLNRLDRAVFALFE